jgi:MT-A70
LHLPVVDQNGCLIAGARRLEALKSRGKTETPVRIFGIDAIVRGELAENAHHKEFTPSEMVAIAATVEERERALARERMTLGKISAGSETGKTRDKVAAPLGVSGKTLEKAKAIVEAAEAEPEKFGHLVELMDRTSKADAAYRMLKIQRQAEAILAEPPPLPRRGPYRVIVADPPWPYDSRQNDASHDGALTYPSMSIEDICALDVSAIAHINCVLWLWTTNHFMPFAYQILEAWGFDHKTIFTWDKGQIWLGDWLRGQTEHCILAVRGHPTVTLRGQSTLLRAAAVEHSAKQALSTIWWKASVLRHACCRR